MIIETQNTPDANVVNFFPSEKILKSGSAEFADAKSLRKSPLAEKIFDLGGIVSVFITPDMISVTKEEKALWNDLKPQVMAEIMDHFSLGEEAVIPSDAAPNEAEVIRQIQGLINARIRPALQQAAVTLKEGVEKLLTTYIPQVKGVANCKKGQTGAQ